MAKMWEDIKFGLGFGLGFICAVAVLRLIVWLLNHLASNAQMPNVL